MKIISIITLLAAWHGLVSTASAATKNVYFAGGQSNARDIWRNAAAGEIRKVDPNAIVIGTSHPGDALRKWFTTYEFNGVSGRQGWYLADFFNPDDGAQGVLEKAFSEIVAKGDTPCLRGILWFQGEGDQVVATSTADDGYCKDFLAMLDEIATDFQMERPVVSLAIVFQASTAHAPILLSIRSQQERLGKLEGITAYDTKNLERSDGVHLTESAAIEAGVAMAKALIKISR